MIIIIVVAPHVHCRACAGQVTPSGSSCQASCAPGYANVAATVREAACLNGVWRQPTGNMSCVQGTAPCLQPPPSAWLPFAGKWDCKFTPHAAACTASCDARYTKSGNTLSWCYNGQYQQPATNITCTPNGTSFAFYPTVATCKLGGWVYAGGTCAGESVKVYYLSLISSAKGNVSVLCCTRGSSYAKTGSSTAKANCFKHVRPGAAGPQCAKASAASGFFDRGPGAGKLFLAQNASSCTDAVGVGSVRVSCPEGGAAKKLLFKLVTPAAYRSSERRSAYSATAH
ncbi:hypothetical protein OEZ86_001255 [Tetradesmus obliquus]|nr:hypothetical protein OEZ86_001255 [Tetradesmus obliquus]